MKPGKISLQEEVAILQKRTFNCLDLFSGGGGLTEGFFNAGFNVLAHVEKDENACLTLKTRNAYHWLKENNQLVEYEDYLKGLISRNELYSLVPKKVLENVLCYEMSYKNRKEVFNKIDEIIGNEKIDIIIGGPPCQAYSVIGRSRDANNMLNDKRKYLYKEYIKYIKQYEPTMYIFENVVGILSSTDEKGRLMIDKIKRAFNYIGYTFQYKKLNASNYGVLQDRERIIICGWKKEYNMNYPLFAENKCQEKLFDLFDDLPTLRANEEKKAYISTPNELIKKLKIRDESWNILTQHYARFTNENDLQIYKLCQKKFINNGERLCYQNLPKNLKTHNNQKDFQDRFKVLDGNGISHTMVAHIAKDGHHYIHPDISQTRSISVREAARIQSFPDDYFFESSRTAAFTQIGNAVPPVMAKCIAEGCLSELKTKHKNNFFKT